MAALMCKTLTLFIICWALQDGCGLPLSDSRAEQPAPQPQHHVRTKRCSCNSWDDKECVYFCHLDVIWVNTPSKLLPYGLGSPPSGRRRRSADRCECHNAADKTCSAFCQKSPEHQIPNGGAPSAESASANGSTLLASLRSVVKSNVARAKKSPPSTENPGRVKRVRSRTRR